VPTVVVILMLTTSPEKTLPLVVHAVEDGVMVTVLELPFDMELTEAETVGAFAPLHAASVDVIAVDEVGTEVI